MAVYRINEETLVGIADSIRSATGKSGDISVENMSIEIGTIGGVVLPELSNPASESDILLGKEAIDSDGNKITGTIATKTASDLTASGATVTVPAGYYATQTTKSVSTATQATPSITISSSGLITASSTQSAGYVAAGTKSATKQLTTQAAKTVTPSTSSQTAVASGRYTTGAITVAAIPSKYEDVGTETTTYTSELSELEAQISALESALEGKVAGGSGGTGLETCSISIKCSSSDIFGYVYTKVVDGSVTMGYLNNDIVSEAIDVTLNDVLCGGFIFIQTNIIDSMASISVTGDARYEIERAIAYTYSNIKIYVPSIANSQSTITIVNYG